MAEDRAEFAAIPPAGPAFDVEEELELEDALTGARPVVLAQAPPAPLGRTPAYDFVNGRFLPRGAGGPVMLRGLDALGQWVVKCLHTDRGGALAVHPDFGLEGASDLLDGGPFDESASAELYDRVQQALLVHPRITSVEEWQVDYEAGDDFIRISFRVVPEGDDEGDLTFDDFPLPIGG
jgi:hypothetical protein